MVHGLYQCTAKFRSLLQSCSASQGTLKLIIHVNETLVEDASWLRRKSDSLLINDDAELEAVGWGINLAIQWGFRSFTVATDSLSGCVMA